MGERNLYQGLYDFQGSVDDEGNLYDECHRPVGKIKGNEVYDFCNNRQGTIDESGKLWDINHTYVGESHGSNFIGPSYRSTGMSRGDSMGDGVGSEYGALMLLKKRNEWYFGNTPDTNYNFSENEEEDDDDEEPYETYAAQKTYTCKSWSTPRRRPLARSQKKGKGCRSTKAIREEDMLIGYVILALYLIGMFIFIRIYTGVPFSQW